MAIGIGIIGVGTVGSGTVEILQDKIPLFRKQFGLELELRGVAARTDEEVAPFKAQGLRTTTSADELIADPSIQILVELVGGYDLPRRWITAALEAGKHVVTANKALIAKHGCELFPVAARKGVELKFEAAVGGGIPVIRGIQECLVGTRIDGISCIINGTCNYIMTEMFGKGTPFAEVLAVAQKLGYAEADPTFDVDGIDSSHKLAILASLATHTFVDFQKIHVSGIRPIEPVDIQMAREMGCSIKLLGLFRRNGDRVDARVHPCLIPTSHLLASVNGVLNAVHLQTTNLGPTLMTGAGAGRLPTASAVVADIVAIARGIQAGKATPLPMDWYSRENPAPLMPMEEVVSRYYLRLSTVDKAGVLASVTEVFRRHAISVESMIQKPVADPNHVTIIFTTHECREQDVQAALREIDALPESVEATRMIRFAD
jgi:homoserine dehydrogenase